MEEDSGILLRIGVGAERELVPAERIGEGLARLLAIPTRQAWVTIFDVVRYDPTSGEREGGVTHYALRGVEEHSGYCAYEAWAVAHRPKEFEAWATACEDEGIVIQEEAGATRGARKLRIGIPPQMSALAALVRLNRTSRVAEVISPLLAAHADDLDRARSDLERAVAWGGSDVAISRALADWWEGEGKLDDAVFFRERVTHLLPDDIEARDKLGAAYARLGLFPHAAQEFDRAATLAEEPALRLRLEQARDLMWQKSRM